MKGTYLQIILKIRNWNHHFVSCCIRRTYTSGCSEGLWKFEILGRTRDDAAGEAFDKVARASDLDIREDRRLISFQKREIQMHIAFPRAKIEIPYDFSFSGVKISSFKLY